jgi:hypothetical protein
MNSRSTFVVVVNEPAGRILRGKAAADDRPEIRLDAPHGIKATNQISMARLAEGRLHGRDMAALRIRLGWVKVGEGAATQLPLQGTQFRLQYAAKPEPRRLKADSHKVHYAKIRIVRARRRR